MQKLSLEAALSLFFDNFGNKDKQNTYLFMLKEHNEEKIVTRLLYLVENWQPKYGEKIPSIAEILNGGVDEVNAEIEQAWTEFVRTKNNHLVFKPIPDWVYTVRQLLGGEKVSEEATDEDLIWQKKEFAKIWPGLKKGMISLQKDPRASQYLIVGGSTMMIAPNTDPMKLLPDVREAFMKRQEQQALLHAKAKELTNGRL